MEKPKHNRRYFLKSVFTALGIGFVVSWDKMINAQKKINGSRILSFVFNPNKEIDFRNEVIIVSKDEPTKVFSSRCTHLGCKINKEHNGQLQCPCHGSTFDLNGNATKGPAIKPLKQLEFEIDKVNNKISVEL